jgi:type I restriction enzyme S subunit
MGVNGWSTVPLGELYEFRSGLSKPRSEFGFGHGFLSFKDVFENYFVPDRLTQLVNSTEAERELCSIRRGDIFLTRTSETMDELGMSCVALKDYEAATFNGFTKRLRPKSSDQVVPEYAGYYFRSPTFRRDVTAMSSMSTRASLNNEMLERLRIVLPPLPVQEFIGSILKSLDDKIGLNRRMNATLEAISRALFQSWFVDFDPVRARLGGRQPADLDRATAALFPAQFKDSPIGRVPKGWNVERFDAHITAQRGLSYNGAGLREDQTGLPMHNLNSVYEGGGYKHEGIKYYAGEYREKHLLQPGDMIVTNTEQGFDHLLIGHAAIVPKCYGPKGIYSHHIYRVRHKSSSPFSPHYLVELFNNRRWHYWISGFSNGTTINMLPMDALEMPMLVVPPIELVKKFTALTEAAHLQIEDNIQQSRTLATLRDALLPKLLSGELVASP